jgi:phage terminase small subunit
LTFIFFRATISIVGRLTVKNKLFAKEYIIDLNATNAAIRAGFSEKTAYSIGHDLLKKPEVYHEIGRLMAKREKRLESTADEALLEIRRMAFYDPGDMFNPDGTLKPIDEIPVNVRRAITGLEVLEVKEGRGAKRKTVGILKKVRFDKKGAVEMFAKHHRLLTDKIEHSGPGGAPLNMTVKVELVSAKAKGK